MLLHRSDGHKLIVLLAMLLVPVWGEAAEPGQNANLPSPQVVLGAGNFKSTYSRDKGIVFDARPQGPWEYMATGTGKTGIAVMAHEEIEFQINHEASLDEHAWLRAPGRLRLRFEGDPISASARAGRFRMVHDLRRSVIRISADTEHGPLEIEIRAHVERDLIRVDIHDGRKTPGPVTLILASDWETTGCDTSCAGTIHLWHENGEATDWHAINAAGGLKNDGELVDPLKNRCFGIAIAAITSGRWLENKIELPGARHTAFHIAAAATMGRERLLKTFDERIATPRDKIAFVAEHEAWWRAYWARVWFESDASMHQHMAAYDMYRYFSAVTSGREREFPVRFQINLLASTLRQIDWTYMHINSVQSIEAYWPMLKNGDWDQLMPLLSFYQRTRPLYLQWCQDLFEHPGLVIPYCHNLWGGPHYYQADSRKKTDRPRFDDKEICGFLLNQWARYSFEHGVALMQMAKQAADARGDKRLEQEMVIPMMRDLCDFFLNHYKKENGKLVFDPATSGETWYEVRNPTSWILLFRTFLPDVIALANEYDDKQLAATASELLASLPDVPRGKWRSDQDVFLPAEVFDRHKNINWENPELYGIWPYGALGVGMPDYDIALRSYRGRLWKNHRHGWCLDVIWAARLGLTDDVLRDYDAIHFPTTLRAPGGFSFETAPTWPEEPSLPLYPSMQGMGTSVCHLYEMVCQDRDDGILVLPAWPRDKPLRMAMYSAVAGRVEIEYEPGKPPRVKTERPVPVTVHKVAPSSRMDAGVVDTSVSSNSLLRPIPIHAVTMGDGFWRSRMKANKGGFPTLLAWLDKSNQTAPFRAFSRYARSGDDSGIRAALDKLKVNLHGEVEGSHRGGHTWTPAVMALIEACAYVLQSGDDPRISSLLDEFVVGVVAAHKNEEFLDIYYGDDFQYSAGLATCGHLIQAAIAHHRATGSKEFLKCATDIADAVCEKFQGERFAGHSCIEMALVELYRTTGDAKYLRGARHFLEPLLRQSPVIGGGLDGWKGRHVVRQTYLCAGGADYLAETGDAAFRDRLNAIWNDMTIGKLHLSGQLGVSSEHPEFIIHKPFELSVGVSNLYNNTPHGLGFELCEAVGNAYLSWRMFSVTGEAQYADQFERVLYNGLLAHVSLDGTKFYYACALASDGKHPPRNAWGHLVNSCCPPNALRLIASLPGYVFSTSDRGLWVHLYDDCRLDWHLADGTPVTLIQRTRYPWEGNVAIEIKPAKPAAFDLNLRIPGWCRDSVVKVNGKQVDCPVKSGSYCRVNRSWAEGDVVTIDLSMPVLAMAADPRVLDLKDKTALMRGPLVYCFEGVDNPGRDVSSISLTGGRGIQPLDNGAARAGLYQPCAKASGFDAVFDIGMFSGMTVLRQRSGSAHEGSAGLTAIPYFAWANRDPSPMRVWVDRR